MKQNKVVTPMRKAREKAALVEKMIKDGLPLEYAMKLMDVEYLELANGKITLIDSFRLI